MPSAGSSPGSRVATAENLAREGADLLKRSGIETPEREARLLLEGIVGISGLDLLKEPGRPITIQERDLYLAAVMRRTEREPVSRILGWRSFYGREFLVTPATLDPRPDTETLVEFVLEAADRMGGRERPYRIVDIGTGTGCILLTLLAELPNAQGLGTDISAAALEVAQANARRLGVSGRVAFLQGRSLERIAGPFDVLVSNPPYIPTRDIDGLEPDVRQFDPLCALDGGSDGCDVFRSLADKLTSVVPGGLAAFEVGAGQAGAVAEIINPGQRLREERRWDLGGHERVVAVWTQL